ncbi:hypothetical protein Vretimale_15613 [Volvox reticuliferus]|uniref:Uncharacterized protein n=1 Tax=Volvox reticuliferus TaxID=1737510 RepID=A0A8J4GR34_9CHLO|nr:hypothetical protein Vretimale_15613 [Volvox reticuliferus]
MKCDNGLIFYPPFLSSPLLCSQFGVVPLDTQDHVKAVHKCMPNPANERATFFSSAIRQEPIVGMAVCHEEDTGGDPGDPAGDFLHRLQSYGWRGDDMAERLYMTWWSRYGLELQQLKQPPQLQPQQHPPLKGVPRPQGVT